MCGRKRVFYEDQAGNDGILGRSRSCENTEDSRIGNRASDEAEVSSSGALETFIIVQKPHEGAGYLQELLVDAMQVYS